MWKVSKRLSDATNPSNRGWLHYANGNLAGTVVMTDFVRNVFPGEALLNLDTRGIQANANYQAALKLVTEAPRFTTVQILAAMEKVLGGQITQMFVITDRVTTVDIAAHVFEDHLREDHQAKDLQLNLLVNIIKEIVENRSLPKASSCGQAEDLLRRCVLDIDTKYAVKCALFDQQNLFSPFIVVLRYPPALTPRLAVA
jgi:hypothetical protein